jgi:hypothetical protein
MEDHIKQAQEIMDKAISSLSYMSQKNIAELEQSSVYSMVAQIRDDISLMFLGDNVEVYELLAEEFEKIPYDLRRRGVQVERQNEREGNLAYEQYEHDL